jgi:hypothetical protein
MADKQFQASNHYWKRGRNRSEQALRSIAQIAIQSERNEPKVINATMKG